ncbi:MAG: hypothetical protein AAF525_18355 [Pseudomonadota bacterium]
MDWEAIGAVGEILGALAVVASLFYLGVQIRRQTQQAKASMIQSLAAEFAKSSDLIIQNPHFATAVLKASRNEHLSPQELLQITQLINRNLNSWLAVQHAYDRGQVDRDYFETICKDVDRLTAIPVYARQLRRLLSAFPNDQNHEMFARIPEDVD